MTESISIPYGEGTVTVDVADTTNVRFISMPAHGNVPDETRLLKEALDHPIHSRPVEELVTPQDRIVIVVNDHTQHSALPQD